jgi:hypothetical protein
MGMMESIKESIKDIHRDRSAYMLNIGIGLVVGYLFIATSMIAYYCYSLDIMQGGFMSNLWDLAPLIFAVGAMIIVSRWLQDPKFVLIIGCIAGIAYYLIFVGW